MKRLAWLVILSGIIGCSDGDAGGGGGDPIPLAELGTELGATTCAKMIECCTMAELEERLLGASTLEECEAFYAAFLGTLLIPVLEDSVADGRLEYDGGEARQCVDAFATLDCAELSAALDRGPIGDCDSPFTAKIAIGGECASDTDCISHLCNGDRVDFEGNVTMGVCAEMPGNGEPCVDRDCGAGLYCDSTSGPTPTCVPTLADGATCRFDDDCTAGSCNGNENGQDGTCGASMSCDGL